MRVKRPSCGGIKRSAKLTRRPAPQIARKEPCGGLADELTAYRLALKVIAKLSAKPA
jgi:hypothetical protein